jgi:hypothetical protein
LLHAQYFEGEIKYINTFKSNIPGISDEKLGSLIGVNQDYFIKGGHYKSISDGSTITMQIYDDKSNRVYNKTRGSDTIYWFDASTNTDSVISYKKEKNRQNILGIQCDVLIAKTKTGTTTYFYNDRYKVDAYRFSNHKYGNWAFFVLETGALPLKTIIESDQFKMESTVVEINPSKLKESFFEIDAGLPIKKSR